MRLFSIGHSTRTWPEFLELLDAHGIRGVADVRAIPASGRQPWFNREPLSAFLREKGYAYHWFGEELGGGRDDSPRPEVAGLSDPAHRGYAVHMGTPLFAQGLERLIALAGQRPTALMCAEAAPPGCHRLFLCDALVVRGIEVVHAIAPDALRPHQLHPAALVRGTSITYPPRQAALF